MIKGSAASNCRGAAVMLACLSSLRDAQFSSTRLAALTPFCCLVGAAVAGALALRRLQFRFAALQDGVEAVLAQQRQLLEGARPAPRRARPPAIARLPTVEVLSPEEAQQILEEHTGDCDSARMRWLQQCGQTAPTRQAVISLLQRPVVAWVDGVFDLMHYGHMYMFLKARTLTESYRLVVGVNSDESVRSSKGTTPILAEDDRVLMVKQCKFVDEVETDVPYVMSSDYLSEMREKHQVTFICHGNDPCFDAEGNDVYAEVKALKMYKEVPRVTGISSTELIGRLLLYVDTSHQVPETDLSPSRPHGLSIEAAASKWKFIPTGAIMREFYDECKRTREPGQPIVYIDGAWDMLHAGHVRTLLRVREHARMLLQTEAYLLVGVHADHIVAKRWPGSPVMNLHERVLATYAMKPVDDVVIDAPWKVSREFLDTHDITHVYHITNEGCDDLTDERFSSIRDLGMMQILFERPLDGIGIEGITQRVISNHKAFARQHARKASKEEAFYKSTLESRPKTRHSSAQL